MPIDEVKTKVFYHLHSGEWKVGETYRIGEKRNGFSDSIIIKDYNCIKARSDELVNLINSGLLTDFIGQNTESRFFLNKIKCDIQNHHSEIDLIQNIEEYKSRLLERQDIYIKCKVPDLAELMLEYIESGGILRNYLLTVREDVLEEVRLDSYPELPSRKKCIWVIADNGYLNESINFWWNELNRKGQLLKLELTGCIFHANEQYLPMTIKSIEYVRGMADQYWRGSIVGDPTRDEYLFMGDARVIDVVCKDYETFEKNGIE